MAAGLLLGLGSVTLGTGLVHASERGGLLGVLEALFRAPAEPAPVPVPPIRHTALPDPHRLDRPRLVPQTPRPGLARIAERPRRRPAARTPAIRAADLGSGTRTVCVRMCDGYLFPLGNLRDRNDLPVHRAACAAACPGASTSLYTLAWNAQSLDAAVSPQGLPYKTSALANLYRQRRVADCSCQPAPGASPLPIASDPTLDRNDVVATRDSARIVVRDRAGGYALEDYRSARLPAAYARQIEARIGAGQRESRARAFRLALRTPGGAGIVRVAAAEIDPGTGFRPVARAAGAFAAVRVVAPSPFVQ